MFSCLISKSDPLQNLLDFFDSETKKTLPSPRVERLKSFLGGVRSSVEVSKKMKLSKPEFLARGRQAE